MNLLISLDDILGIINNARELEADLKPYILEDYNFQFDLLTSLFEVNASESGIDSKEKYFDISEVFYIFHALINEMNQAERETLIKKKVVLENILKKVLKDNKASREILKKIKEHVSPQKKKKNVFKARIIKG